MHLLADCGNTTIKLALADRGGLWLFARVPPDESSLDAFLDAHDGDVDDLVSVPGSAANAARVALWWTRAGRGRPSHVVGRELALPALGQYPTCGADRVLAGLAAAAHGPAVVVDAGTATTLTAWHEGPRFGGGLILPGARACLAGLAAQAPALPLAPPLAADASACQHTTPGAIGAAIGIGYPAMVAACAARVCAESGIATVVVTGGAAGTLSLSASVRPSLVLEGLALLLSSSPG
jgi:pantothenate kinase type III